MNARSWLMIATGIILGWSAVDAQDYPTWLFELSFGLAGILLLILTYNRFRFTNLIYALVVLHFFVLAIGAKYTYAESPPGFWLQGLLGLDRNPFDRVGHFMQGFVPPMIAREIFLRCTKLEGGWILSFLVVCFCLAFSAFYELIEWWIVIFFYPDAGPAWLGHQGDPWDAQADMMMALTGSILALLTLSGVQSRQMSTLNKPRLARPKEE